MFSLSDANLDTAKHKKPARIVATSVIQFDSVHKSTLTSNCLYKKCLVLPFWRYRIGERTIFGPVR